MIVVADTSVILNLCRVQHEHLLQQLFKRVLFPAEVAGEFTRLAKIQKRFLGMVLPNWIEIASAPQAFPPEVVRVQLDTGEAAAITLCLNQKADLLLIDEVAGREVATRLGVRTVGILGMLVDARNQKLISDVKSLLDRLEREAGFWISLNLRRHVLQLTGE
jgi:predicted nucleic acid-binding protein